MTDLPPYPDSNSDTGDDTRVRPDRGSPSSTLPGTPRWVKAFAIIVIVVVLLAVIMTFTGIGGQHGPRRHLPSGGRTAPIERGVQLS